MMPLVSIYIPTFNRHSLLRRAISSVISQSYQNIELLVVDDCSSDETQAYMEHLQAQDSRIKYFRLEENSGACVCRNVAIKNAAGAFITGLDDDDYLSEHRVDGFLSAWAHHEAAGRELSALFSHQVFILPSGKEKKLKRESFVFYDLLKKSNMLGSQVFTKTEYLVGIAGFDPAMPAWQDYEAWFRLLKKYGPAYVVNDYSYYVDESHESERISDGRMRKLELACELFHKKHVQDFSKRDFFLFKRNLYAYKHVEMPFSVLRAAINARCFIDFFPLYIKKLVQKILAGA